MHQFVSQTWPFILFTSKYLAAFKVALLTPLINLIIEGLFMEYIFSKSIAVLFIMFFHLQISV